jgi:quinol monooxygenase YgiN
MELFIFGRFHSKAGAQDAVAEAMREMLVPVRAEPGCLAIEVFQSTRDARLFYVHSRWRNEADFEIHTGLPHTIRFVERVAPLIDHPLEVIRAKPLGSP